jgi:hypothetical protein
MMIILKLQCHSLPTSLYREKYVDRKTIRIGVAAFAADLASLKQPERGAWIEVLPVAGSNVTI